MWPQVIWAKWGDAVKKVKLGRSEMRGDAFLGIESTSCPPVTVLDSSVCLIVFRWYYRPVVYLWTHIIPSLEMLMLINRLPQYLGQFPRRNRKMFSCTPLIFERDPLVSRLAHAVSHAAVCQPCLPHDTSPTAHIKAVLYLLWSEKETTSNLTLLLIHFIAVKLEAKQEVEPACTSDVLVFSDHRKWFVVSDDLLTTVWIPCYVFGSCQTAAAEKKRLLPLKWLNWHFLPHFVLIFKTVSGKNGSGEWLLR